jgi:hypothetical protein
VALLGKVSTSVGRLSLDTSRSLNPALLDSKFWLAKYKDYIPAE